MTEQEIIEGNKLIAEFMKLDTECKDVYNVKQFLINPKDDILYYWHITSHCFHSSWDWLMPCCIKMIRVSPEKCSLLREYLGNCSIDEVYKQLIFLIKNLD